MQTIVEKTAHRFNGYLAFFMEFVLLALNLSLKLGHVRRSHFLGPAQCSEQ